MQEQTQFTVCELCNRHLMQVALPIAIATTAAIGSADAINSATRQQSAVRLGINQQYHSPVLSLMVAKWYF